MAAKLLIQDPQDSINAPAPLSQGSGPPPKSMNRESQVRSVAVILFLLTVAAVVFAGFNFNAELKVLVPDDGVWWVEHNGSLIAGRVEGGRPGAKSGIQPGDQLVSIDGREVKNVSGVVRQI